MAGFVLRSEPAPALGLAAPWWGGRGRLGAFVRHGDAQLSVVVTTAALVAGLAAIGLAASEQPCPAVTHVARALAPGEVVVLTVACPTPLEGVEATAFGKTIPFVEAGDPGTWQALVGIDLGTAPGKYTVHVTARAGASSFTGTHRLTVAAREFRTRRLTLAREFVTPPASARARIEQEAKRVGALMSAVTPGRLWRAPILQPVPGPMISPFGTLSILNGTPGSRHGGADFRGAEGTPILAPAAGRIVLTGDLYFSGQTVIIDHGLGLVSLLAHLSQIRVREGDTVARGEEVGAVGSTGRVTGPHLHWTVRLLGARVDPMALLAVLGGTDGR